MYRPGSGKSADATIFTGFELCAPGLRSHAAHTAPQILAQLREAVLSFSANTSQYDDITMMVLGCRES